MFCYVTFCHFMLYFSWYAFVMRWHAIWFDMIVSMVVKSEDSTRLTPRLNVILNRFSVVHINTRFPQDLSQYSSHFNPYLCYSKFKKSGFWDFTPWSTLEMNLCFWETCLPPPSGSRVSQAWNQQPPLLHASFLLHFSSNLKVEAISSSEISVEFLNRLHGGISKTIELFLATAART
jgi:hypothetical protein